MLCPCLRTASLFVLSTLFLPPLSFADDSIPVAVKTKKTTRPDGVPPVVRSVVGDSSAGWEGKLRLVNIGKRQQKDFSDKATLDCDIFSPKSVNFNPTGDKIYVNSLEGGKTVVYSVPSLRKEAVVSHIFSPDGQQGHPTAGPLWAPKSGFYLFTHYPGGDSRAFTGKPVEGVFSHGGRYFWVPYYRRTFDINAQDPSAVAVIDTSTDSIVRMFETGPLPKMIAYSDALKQIAVTHWGDNTVGLINVHSRDVDDWHHLPPMVAGTKVHLDFPLDRSIDRDANSGYKLRGTVYTPDGRYLLVSAMSGPMQVFDMTTRQYIGFVNSAYGVRHLVIKDGMLFGSQNVAATALSIPLDSVVAGIERAVAADSRSIVVKGWRSCKVGGGARTIGVSPDSELLFVACNSASEVCVVEASTMTVVDRIRVDSYPVGLDVSGDGTLLAVTSQGRKGYGGNALNLFKIIRPGVAPFRTVAAEDTLGTDITSGKIASTSDESGHPAERSYSKILLVGIVVVILFITYILLGMIWRIIYRDIRRKNQARKEKERK